MAIKDNNILVVIPARGGSKGVPGKNIKPLNGKPLIYYTLDIARSIFHEVDICVSTDDEKIINSVKTYGQVVPFRRPDELSGDQAGMYDVLKHAVSHYNNSKDYEIVVLLQPTSPFKSKEDIISSIELYLNSNVDMVVSVKETSSNPYYVLFEENINGHLIKSKESPDLQRRQDAPKVYELNGAIYVIKTASLFKYDNLFKFPKIKKYQMSANRSIDIDNNIDWDFAEFLLKKNKS